MKKLILFSAALSILLSGTACKKDSADSAADGRKYEIKAGSFTYSMSFPGMGPVEVTTYFDDYGSKECTESKSEFKMFGQSVKQHTRSITKDGYAYTIDMLTKTGSKTKIDEALISEMKMGAVAMAAAMKDKANIKELGTEDFLGKKCRKIQMSMDEGKSYGTFWLWKNITLKMESKDPKSNQSMSFAATKVEELSKAPEGIFEIPTDFIITESKIPNLEEMSKDSAN